MEVGKRNTLQACILWWMVCPDAWSEARLSKK